MADVIGRRQFDTQSSRIIPNVMKSIILIDSNLNDAGFLAFFSRVPKEITAQEKFNWDVDNFLTLTDTVDGAVTGTTATTIGVDNPTRYIPGQLWLNKRTGEIYQVTAVNTATSNITVKRAVTALSSSGGTAAAAISDADTLIRLAPAVGENSSRQSTQTTTPTAVFNYTQAFRWDLSLSRRQIKRQYETGDELPYQTQKQLKEAQKQLNAAFIDGERARFTSNGDDITLTAGIRGVPSTHTWAVGGTMHENSLDEFLVENGLRQGSRNKVLFASTNVILAFTQVAKERLTHNIVPFGPAKGGMGMQVLEYMAPNGGKLMIVEDRHLSEAHNGDAIGVDMGQLKRKVFTRNGFDDDLHFIADTQDKDDLGFVTTLYGDMGLQYGAEQTHFKITGVTGGAIGTSSL